MQRAERRPSRDQGAEGLLALHAREVEHHVFRLHRSRVVQHLGERPDRVVPHGQEEHPHLADPGRRAVVGADGEREGLGDLLFVPAMQLDPVAGGRQGQSEADPSPARPDDPDARGQRRLADH